MDLGLQGRAVVVTGGAAGIGAAIVQVLREEGAVPLVLDRSPPVTASPSDEGGPQPHPAGTARHWTLALEDEAALLAVARELREHLQRQGLALAGLVHNAGGNDSVGLEAPTAAWRGSLERNLLPAMVLTRELREPLRQAGGAIVNIASKTAVTGQGGTSGYVAAKGALLALTREWAVALRDDGIRVNAVVPAEVWTGSYERWLRTFDDPAGRRAAIERRIPLQRRMTLPREIADTVVFTLSPRCGHTTGQWMFVDGGYTHLDRALD